MQQPSHTAYQGYYQPQSNTSTQIYRNTQPSYGYAEHNTADQPQVNGYGYGIHNAASTQPTPRSAYDYAGKSYEATRASKRARIERSSEDDTPTRSSGSWVPSSSSDSQPSHQRSRGLALPPMPPPARPVGVNAHSTYPGEGRHSFQSTPQDDISSPLEQQVHGLAQYNYQSSDRDASFISAQRRDEGHVAHDATVAPEESNETHLMLPERGAKDGNMLNLACVMCMKKKRKCSKNFPCNECNHHEEQCVPSVRKIRGSAVGSADQLNEHENEEPAEPVAEDSGPPREKRVVRDHNDPNRKYLINLPQVIDGYQEWSNMRLKYNPIPEDLDAVREKLFKLEKPILLNSQQYADYWPHMSNIWSRSVAPFFEANGTQVETWECRNQRRQARHQRIKGPGGHGLRKRERKLHLLEGTEMCKIRFRIVAYIKHADTDEDHRKGMGTCNCVPEWLFLERTRLSPVSEHNHTLESMDRYKRTDAMLFFAEYKVMEGGYLYKAVRRWIHDHYKHVSKEVEYLTDHDVANAARRWRVQNPTIELVDTIPEPSPEEERREKCLQLIPTTTLEGLQRALREVCARLPEATEIALPYLESSQAATAETRSSGSNIVEGDDIDIPPPGLPVQRGWMNVKPTAPNQELSQFVANKGIDPNLATSQSPGASTIVQQFPHQPLSANGPPPYPNMQIQPSAPLPPPAQTHAPPLAPVPPPISSQPIITKFRVYQPRIATPTQPKPPDGRFLVNGGGHRHHFPAAGATALPPLPPPPPQTVDMRPSWAKPDVQEPVKMKEKQVVEPETDEMKVQRQLQAELET